MQQDSQGLQPCNHSSCCGLSASLRSLRKGSTGMVLPLIPLMCRPCSSQAARGPASCPVCALCMQVAFVLAALLATGFAAEHSECTSQRLWLGHTRHGSRSRAQHRAHSSATIARCSATLFRRHLVLVPLLVSPACSQLPVPGGCIQTTLLTDRHCHHGGAFYRPIVLTTTFCVCLRPLLTPQAVPCSRPPPTPAPRPRPCRAWAAARCSSA